MKLGTALSLPLVRKMMLWMVLFGGLACSALFSMTFVSALSASASPSSSTGRQFVELKKASSFPHDRLPASFIASWPTWVLETSEDNIKTPKWHKIPDTDGFVPPTSLDELWQPIDLQYPSCRIAVGLHVRNGSIRHIFPAVDLTLGDHDSYRNRGLCSVPRAYQWMEFGSLALGGGLDACSIVLQSRENDKTAKWITHGHFQYIRDVVNRAVTALADATPDELGDGSSIIHVLCDADDKGTPHLPEIPRVGADLRCLLIEEDGSTMGALQVKISKTAAGSESEYLPEVYTELFQDESLRRPAFVEMKRRMNRKEGQEPKDESWQ